ncbi:hypothetical protein [Pseudomonas fluorescens]|uniref:hypothetical protein n=1 Tax=Pseudomonas fluorescens TaxID=294 RepID=UPI001242F171|nr:hypothetical protein [Pseudomonas fluorescens]
MKFFKKINKPKHALSKENQPKFSSTFTLNLVHPHIVISELSKLTIMLNTVRISDIFLVTSHTNQISTWAFQ